MPINDIEFGGMMQKLESIHTDVAFTKGRVEELRNFQVLAEERLKNGVRHFDKLDARVQAQEARECPRTPRPVTTYWLICGGFMVIGALMSIFKFIK